MCANLTNLASYRENQSIGNPCFLSDFFLNIILSCRTIAIMESRPNARQLKAMNKLVERIDGINEYLQKFIVRENLKQLTREKLVECQIEKAQLIAKLKIAARNFEDVPQSIKELYF